MGAVVSNNAWGTLAVPVTAQATELTLSSSQGDRFPSAVLGVSWFFVTLVDSSNNIEIVKCTQRRGDSLTVMRGADNTIPKAFRAGDRVELRPCAALFDDKVSQDKLNEVVDTLTRTWTTNLDEATKQLNTKIQEAEARSLSRTDYATKEAEWKSQNTNSFLTKTDAANIYLPKTGGTINGKLTITGVGGQDSLILNWGHLRVQNGDFSASGGIWARDVHTNSDKRLKKSIVEFGESEGLELVEGLRPVWFTWKDTNTEDFGFIAQELEAICPEAVFERDGRKYVNYPSLVTVAIAAIKGLKEEIEELKKWQKS